MKAVVIILGILSACLLAALVLRSKRADNQIEAAQKEITGYSNQLSEAQIKLNHQERMNTAFKGQVDERESALMALTNSIAQIRSKLAAVEEQNATTRQEVGDWTARAGAVAVERDAFSNHVNEVEFAATERERTLREALARTLVAETNLAVMSQQLASEQMQKQRLEDFLKSPAALQNQLKTLHEWETAAKTSPQSGARDYRLPLQLQADGSVSLITPTIEKSAQN